MTVDLIIVATACLVSTAAALLGCFLLLRRMVLLSDAISHTVFPGIVLAFWLSGGERATLVALAGAALAGLLTVMLVHWLTATGRVKNDAAIGLVFPALFSLGVLAVSLYFRNVHLDLDAVLYGEIAYAPFNTLEVFGRPLGPESLWLSGGLALIDLAFVLLFYKELKLSTFDPDLAAALGFYPGLVHYALMGLVSLTAVVSFQSVGAILIVALLSIPAAAAYLLTHRLSLMLVVAVAMGVVASVVGYLLAILWDAAIAAMIATVAAGLLLLAWLFSPLDGLLVAYRRRKRQRQRVAVRLLVTHLAHHHRPVPRQEVLEEFGWSPAFLARVEHLGQQLQLLRVEQDQLQPTVRGLQELSSQPPAGTEVWERWW